MNVARRFATPLARVHGRDRVRCRGGNVSLSGGRSLAALRLAVSFSESLRRTVRRKEKMHRAVRHLFVAAWCVGGKAIERWVTPNGTWEAGWFFEKWDDGTMHEASIIWICESLLAARGWSVKLDDLCGLGGLFVVEDN